jgi:hypothetical protein
VYTVIDGWLICGTAPLLLASTTGTALRLATVWYCSPLRFSGPEAPEIPERPESVIGGVWDTDSTGFGLRPTLEGSMNPGGLSVFETLHLVSAIPKRYQMF